MHGFKGLLFANHPTLGMEWSVLAASYTITANNTWEDTGLDLRLPEAGRYLLVGAITGFQLNTTNLASLLARFWDERLSAVVANSEIRVCGTTANVTQLLTSFMFAPYKVRRKTTIRLEAQRNNVGTWTASQIFSASNDSWTRIGYLKLARF